MELYSLGWVNVNNNKPITDTCRTSFQITNWISVETFSVHVHFLQSAIMGGKRSTSKEVLAEENPDMQHICGHQILVTKIRNRGSMACIWTNFIPSIGAVYSSLHLSLVSTERYESVWFGTVLFGMAPLDLACVSTADHTLTWWAGFMPDACMLCCRSAS